MRVLDEVAALPGETGLEDVDCGACSSPKRAFVSELSGYRFHRCLECGLVYMSPRPSESALGELYDEVYFSSDDPGVGYPVYREDAASFRDKATRLLSELERHVEPGRFLDVGCAYGFSLEVARERGWDVFGVEPARPVAEQVRARLGAPVETDLFGARFGDDAFDAIALWDVIEHLPRLRPVLAELARILRPGGVLSVVTPDAGSLAAKLLGDHWEERRKMPEHIYFFERDSLSRLLIASGFAPLGWGTVGKLMPVSEAAERLVPAVPRLLRPMLRRLVGSRAGRKVVYLDPRWKLSVAARNERGAEANV